MLKQNKATVLALTAVIACSLTGVGLLCFRMNQEYSWRSLTAEAQNAYAKEDFPTAKEKYEKAVKLALDSFGEEDARYIDSLKRLAWVFDAHGDYSRGREIFVRIYKLNPEEQTRIRLAQTALAFIEPHQDEPPAPTEDPNATRSLRISADIIEKYLGSSAPQRVVLLKKMAWIYAVQKQYAEAEEQVNQIMKLEQETEGAESVGVARTHKLAGEIYQYVAANTKSPEERKVYDAKKVHEYNEAIAMFNKVLGQNAPQAKEVQALLEAPNKPARAIKDSDFENTPLPKL